MTKGPANDPHQDEDPGPSPARPPGTMTKPMPDHDHPYKILFRQPELVADLLRLVVSDLADECDLTTLDRRNGSYVTPDWREREDDLVWRVRWKGQDLYVLALGVPVDRRSRHARAHHDLPRSAVPRFANLGRHRSRCPPAASPADGAL